MALSRSERRQKVLDELLVLIEAMLDAGEPFSEMSVERLTSSAGMSRTRFYLYFEDKNDLIMAWFGRIRDRLSDARWWAAEPPSDRAELTDLVKRMLLAYRPHATLMAAVEEVAAAAPAVRSELEAAVDADARALTAYISRAQARHSIAPDLDAEAVARWLTLLTWRGRRHLLRAADEAEIARLAAAHAALVWNVLYARAADVPS